MSEAERGQQHQDHREQERHGHAHPVFDRAYWEDRYGQPGRAWSGRPNAALVAEVAALTPGRALDVGSGEGGDALWLAARGWQVTGVDISQNALDKAAALAREREDVDPARLTWQQADLTGWSPTRTSFDLVTAHFMHLPPTDRERLFPALADGVAPGGTLLIVGHDVDALPGGAGRHGDPGMLFTVDEVVGRLSPDAWRVEVAEVRPRDMTGPDGDVWHVADVVVRATRRAG
ncbi:class I SAM-dependent methyltransferase [Frigoribacterium sp. CFBP 8751]|uniref:class I SAM-dependent methyltransferase n=1 Tax=Frigoribacterium sp. CFBP 8751 TaxID=2775277 RepID=UPI001780F5C0|nr:class I SAM-dependent methyltransferase [Frigoribacterium sp. CFBP 8751]MBD8540452.1 class I SAM-dependent methyltransferase [Frigoribacterium sp. CFBP 8751]